MRQMKPRPGDCMSSRQFRLVLKALQGGGHGSDGAVISRRVVGGAGVMSRPEHIEVEVHG
jgi:hypothetical protein